MQTTPPEQDGQYGSADGIRSFYDRLASGEADRLVKDLPGRVSFEVHRRFLRRHLSPGSRVLEIGAGEAEQTAMQGMLRVVRPGGMVLASVMSLWGTWRAGLRSVLSMEAEHGTGVGDMALATGDLRHVPGLGHVCRMFTWQEVTALVHASDTQIVDGSASNWASLQHGDALAVLEQDEKLWQRFLNHEATACAAPGARDGGTHILFAARN